MKYINIWTSFSFKLSHIKDDFHILVLYERQEYALTNSDYTQWLQDLCASLLLCFHKCLWNIFSKIYLTPIFHFKGLIFPFIFWMYYLYHFSIIIYIRVHFFQSLIGWPFKTLSLNFQKGLYIYLFNPSTQARGFDRKLNVYLILAQLILKGSESLH